MPSWKPPIVGVGAVPITAEHANGVMFVCAEDDDGSRQPIGTAFRVGMPGGVDRSWKYYVTAAHVVQDGRPTWIRFRRSDGSGVQDERVGEWIPHRTADVAATPCEVDVSGLVARWVPDWMFSDRWYQHSRTPLSPGEKVYFVGLLTDVPTMAQRNIPMIRSGRVGALFQEDIPMRDGMTRRVEPTAHLLDSFSRGGFSGSPVFVDYPLIGRTRDREYFLTGKVALLGMVIGHFNSMGDNAGIAVVTPVEAIRELLNEERLMDWRERKEEAARQRRDDTQWESAATTDAAIEDSEFDRFQDLAKKLVQVPKPELDAERKKDDT